MDRVEKVHQFRQRAMELRNAALALQSGEGRESLLVMADEYERLADRMGTPDPQD